MQISAQNAAVEVSKLNNANLVNSLSCIEKSTENPKIINCQAMNAPITHTSYLAGGDTSISSQKIKHTLPISNNRNKVIAHTGDLLKNYPQVVASNEQVYVVKGTDGRYRGVPNELGDLSHFESNYIYHKATRYFDAYFDAPAHFGNGLEKYRVSLLTGGFHFDEEDMTFNFKVPEQETKELTKIQSISDKYNIFPIGANRWMIGQPTLKTCSFACEEMLLAQGKNAEDVKKQVESRFNSIYSERRSDEDVLKSINSRIGPDEKPYKIHRSSGNAYFEVLQFEKFLKEKVDGPVYFGTNGHARLIDGFLPEGIIPGADNIEFFAAMRDPFTTNCVLTIGRDIFRHCGNQMFSIQPGSADWSIIYRPKD